jgi:hypothetical protein
VRTEALVNNVWAAAVLLGQTEVQPKGLGLSLGFSLVALVNNASATCV